MSDVIWEKVRMKKYLFFISLSLLAGVASAETVSDGHAGRVSMAEKMMAPRAVVSKNQIEAAPVVGVQPDVVPELAVTPT